MEIKQKTRAEIPDAAKWRINDLIASDEIWQQQTTQITEQIEQFSRFKGKVAQQLTDCIAESLRISEQADKLYVYANLKLHEDTNNTTYQGFADIVSRINIKMMAAFAFLEPEILAIPEQTLAEKIAEQPLYKHYLDVIIRKKAHIKSAEIEEILEQAEELGEAPSNIFDMLDDADLKFGTITDENGNTIELTHGRYSAMLESDNREVRKAAWHKYYDGYWALKNTLATTHIASIKRDVFFAKMRNYPSALDAALFGDNIPSIVYSKLIATVHKFLPAMHRYMEIRKKALNLPDLRVYDLYTPIIKQINTKIEYSAAIDTVLKSLAPLGEDYIKIAEKGLRHDGWVDVYENVGKRSGAYSWGAYGGHPYILLNYENKMDDMFTLAHELGHSMHSYYSWQNQQYIYSDYTIFLAEVASTVNEALLLDYLLKEAEKTGDSQMKAYLVNTWLEQFRTTLFRQTLFAEFEMITHKMAENDEPLTVDVLNSVYRGLNAKYYGETVVLDDKLDLEWARIPHFYRAFYVYQYATGYSAAMAFSSQILSDKTNNATEKYLTFLKSGSSDYSINILQKAGVDMSSGTEEKSNNSVSAALQKFVELVDEIGKE
ncbi:MAG: oligoendopeptidase F [Defluviitaleaceae bacterium]|nr:oligoendopeptidase F [Defluviitaleaceae bacterium]